MNGLDLTAILGQIPFVVAFIWYANKTQKDFLAALDARDEKYEERNKALIEAINANTAQLAQLTQQTCAHDGWTKEAVNLMVENAGKRTITKGGPGKPQ